MRNSSHCLQITRSLWGTPTVFPTQRVKKADFFRLPLFKYFARGPGLVAVRIMSGQYWPAGWGIMVSPANGGPRTSRPPPIAAKDRLTLLTRTLGLPTTFTVWAWKTDLCLRGAICKCVMCYSSSVTRLIMINLNILMLIIPAEIPASTQLVVGRYRYRYRFFTDLRF